MQKYIVGGKKNQTKTPRKSPAVTASCCFKGNKIQDLAEHITSHLLYKGYVRDWKKQKGTDCHEESTGQQAVKCQRNGGGLGMTEM